MAQCPKCGSKKTSFRGSKNRPNSFQCKQCQKYFTEVGDPKVLVFDIETLPIIGTFWDTGKQYIPHQNIIEDYVVLSWSAKYLFSPRGMGDILTSKEAQTRMESVLSGKEHNADERIIRHIWKLIDEADCLISQNGIKFDIKKLNTRFLFYGLNPPRPFHHIDTLQAANSAFAVSSHSLDYMMRFLRLARKLPTNYALWLRCMRGDSKALKEMNTYGMNDTFILEDYYAKIRAWIPNHPNFSAYTHRYVDLKAGENSCPVCRHVINESALDGRYRTPLGYVYRSFRCLHCGVVGRLNERDKQKINVRRAG